jgi:Ca2+/Na+ antiporter
MGFEVWTFISGIFILAASCYALFKFSDELEDVGNELGRLLRLPQDVVASTFAALATSGPEIVMAILAATPFILNEAWSGLRLGEKASSGTLNMAFSAMDNLLGIGAVAILFLIYKKRTNPDSYIPIKPSVLVGLGFYVISSFLLSIFITDHLLTEVESWILMILGIVFIISQFLIPNWIEKRRPFFNGRVLFEEDKITPKEPPPHPLTLKWTKEFALHGLFYAFLVFVLIVFVRESLGATFNMAQATIFSVGGIIIMFTSYVSSFPEFMMAYHLAKANKQNALLAMLFGSNVIDLAFAGFRAIWLHEPIEVYTTGIARGLLPFYIWALPTVALLAFVGLLKGKIKYKYAYPAIIFYVIYIVSGFVLL